MTDSSSRAAEQANISSLAVAPDAGHWMVNVWPGDKVVLQSDDFTHDVALIVDGDFGSHEDKLAYANAMAAWMNSNLPAAQNRRSPVSN
jgi:hypothetical protein